MHVEKVHDLIAVRSEKIVVTRPRPEGWPPERA
jgi:hypothetical protein